MPHAINESRSFINENSAADLTFINTCTSDQLLTLTELADELRATQRTAQHTTASKPATVFSAADNNDSPADAHHCTHNHNEDDEQATLGRRGCDCWHCEMFGAATFGSSGEGGRCGHKYAANAERLRHKLERKRQQQTGDKAGGKYDGTNERSSSPTASSTAQLPPIDDVMAFIEGEQVV
jgi:hypothetical protein